MGKVEGGVLMDVLMDVAATYKRLATRNQEYYGTQPSARLILTNHTLMHLRLLTIARAPRFSLPPAFL